MYIFLIFWLVFVFIYIVFNVYGISRVMAMRIKGDATGLIVLGYLIAIFIVIGVSIAIMSNLKWGGSITQLFNL